MAKQKTWRKIMKEISPEDIVFNKKGQICLKRPSLAKCGYFYWQVPKKFIKDAQLAQNKEAD